MSDGVRLMAQPCEARTTRCRRGRSLEASTVDGTAPSVHEPAFPGTRRRNYGTRISDGPNADRTRRMSRSTSTILVVSTSTRGQPPATGSEFSSFHNSADVRWSSKWLPRRERHVR